MMKPIEEIEQIDFDSPEIKKEFVKLKKENKEILKSVTPSPESLNIRFTV